MKLNDWIEPYAVDNNGDHAHVSGKPVVNYIIPSYKIDRLKEVDEAETELQNYRSLGMYTEVRDALGIAINIIAEKKTLEDKKFHDTIMSLAFDGFKMIYGQTQSHQEREDILEGLEFAKLSNLFRGTTYETELDKYVGV